MTYLIDIFFDKIAQHSKVTVIDVFRRKILIEETITKRL